MLFKFFSRVYLKFCGEPHRRHERVACDSLASHVDHLCYKYVTENLTEFVKLKNSLSILINETSQVSDKIFMKYFI